MKNAAIVSHKKNLENFPMLVHSKEYAVDEVKKTPFDKVPRAVLSSSTSKIALDYHSDLCHLKEGDNLKIELFIDEKPVVNKSAYLMQGTIYKIEPSHLEASFGGLLMFYEGELDMSFDVERTIYISVLRL